MKVIVDGREFIEQMRHDFSMIEPHLVYLAGSNDTYQLTKHHVSPNFDGTISEVRHTFKVSIFKKKKKKELV